MSASVLQLGEGKKRKVAKIRTICAVFTTCNKVPHSNQSQVSKVIYYPILCLVFAQWLREKQRDAATATDNMLINWDCTTMPPRRDEALKWLPPERRITAPSCSPFMLKKKKKTFTLCGLQTTFVAGGFSPSEAFTPRVLR